MFSCNWMCQIGQCFGYYLLQSVSYFNKGTLICLNLMFLHESLYFRDMKLLKSLCSVCVENGESQIYSFETGLHASALMALAIDNYVPWFVGSI